MGKEKIISALSALFLFNAASFGQMEVISTGTNAIIGQASITGNCIFVNGQGNYLVKSYNELDSLIPLTVPGPIGYGNDRLNTIDTNNLYSISQFKPF